MLAVALHALVLVFLLPVLLPHRPRPSSPGTGPGDPALSRFLAGALEGAEIALRDPPAPDTPPATPPATPTPAMPEPVAVVEPPFTAAPQASSSGSSAPSGAVADTETRPAAAGGAGGGAAAGSGPHGDGSADVPAEMALRPRVYVQPAIPEDIVRKRKIDDFVLLQVLVGTDGAVRDVRVLRGIANCSECTESADATARRYRYDPVTVDGRLVEMWTVPFSLRFSDHR